MSFNISSTGNFHAAFGCVIALFSQDSFNDLILLSIFNIIIDRFDPLYVIILFIEFNRIIYSSYIFAYISSFNVCRLITIFIISDRTVDSFIASILVISLWPVDNSDTGLQFFSNSFIYFGRSVITDSL